MLAASEIDLDILKVAQGMIDFRLDTVCSNMNPVFGKLQIDVYPSICYNLTESAISVFLITRSLSVNTILNRE